MRKSEEEVIQRQQKGLTLTEFTRIHGCSMGRARQLFSADLDEGKIVLTKIRRLDEEVFVSVGEARLMTAEAIVGNPPRINWKKEYESLVADLVEVVKSLNSSNSEASVYPARNPLVVVVEVESRLRVARTLLESKKSTKVGE
jgi:hypothetical protein